MSDVKDAVKLDVITGPGGYRCANGSLAVVEEHDPSADRDYPWAGYVVGDPFKTQRRRWAADGSRPDHFTHKEEFRLVGRVEPKPSPDQARIASLEAENAALESRLESACQKVVRLEAAQSAEHWGDNAKLHNRITELEAHNAALQTELDSLRAIMDSEHETFLQELILTAYGNAPFGTDHAKVVADAKAMLLTMEGGAE